MGHRMEQDLKVKLGPETDPDGFLGLGLAEGELC